MHSKQSPSVSRFVLRCLLLGCVVGLAACPAPTPFLESEYQVQSNCPGAKSSGVLFANFSIFEWSSFGAPTPTSGPSGLSTPKPELESPEVANQPTSVANPTGGSNPTDSQNPTGAASPTATGTPGATASPIFTSTPKPKAMTAPGAKSFGFPSEKFDYEALESGHQLVSLGTDLSCRAYIPGRNSRSKSVKVVFLCREGKSEDPQCSIILSPKSKP